ncbi:protein DMP2 [Cajanus cajan]|uniref:Uncharacterized protein n=1 Tax=Cajanus cajan TaxID=3821 RepID=A0A151STQ8_CAJCA|nr:protein DMP2 [Cajanus cajan]KYP58151.1 hypothetical protein KK1_004443 [Cajanus cajan]
MNGDSSSSSEPFLSSSQNQKQGRDVTNTALSAVGNFIKLLPTGTVFVFQFLNPVLSNSGECNATYKCLSVMLLVACAFSCVFSSFTDSYTGTDNQRHYAIVTSKGLWPSSVPPANTVDLSGYRLKFGDFVHAALSLLVFAVLALLDTNTVRCLYPGFESTQKILLQVLPTVVGVLAGGNFVISPSKRHGIGYPLTSDPNHTGTSPTSNATAPPQIPNHTA